MSTDRDDLAAISIAEQTESIAGALERIAAISDRTVTIEGRFSCPHDFKVEGAYGDGALYGHCRICRESFTLDFGA